MNGTIYSEFIIKAESYIKISVISVKLFVIAIQKYCSKSEVFMITLNG